MRLTKILVATALPLALSLACGGSASDSGDGDGDGDNSSNGDGDGDTSSGDGDGDTPAAPSSSDGKDDVCETFCDQIEACDGVVVEDCVDSCTGNESTSLVGQEVISECFDADLCTDASEEALALGLICLLTEASDIDLSEEATTFCDESVDTINECLGTEPAADATLGNCDDSVGLASDELLADLNACAERPCDEVEACVQLAALSALPIEAILQLEAGGGEPSPALIADVIALVAVFGQLGITDTGTDLFGGMNIPDPAMGGSAGR